MSDGNNNKGGRPRKLTPAVKDEFCQLLARPVPISTACDLLRISRMSYYRWRDRGQEVVERLQADPDAEIEEKERLYVDFYYETTRARRLGEIGLSGIVIDAARAGDVKSAQWLLERMYKENWTFKQSLEVSGPGGGAVQVEDTRKVLRSIMEDDELRDDAGAMLDKMIEKELAEAEEE